MNKKNTLGGLKKVINGEIQTNLFTKKQYVNIININIKHITLGGLKGNSVGKFKLFKLQQKVINIYLNKNILPWGV